MRYLRSIAAGLLVLAASAWALNPTQLKYESGSGSGFFGGDYRDGNTARNIGTGVAITLTENTLVDQFAFSFGEFKNDETGNASDVTLVYAIRTSDGTLMKMEEVVMADTFTGGWIHWENIGVVVESPGPVIITCYVKDGHTNYITGSTNADADAGDDNSVRYSISKSDDPYDMITWDGFYEHTWDAHYWLQGKPFNAKLPPVPVFMRHDLGDASGFFGGDQRDGNTARNIGTGISVTTETSMTLDRVGLDFGAFTNDSTKAAAEATLVFTLRDTDGTPLKSGEVVVPTSFEGGWVEWDKINYAVSAPGPVIVTCYVKDGHTNYTKSSSRGDSDASNDAVERLSCSEAEEPYDMVTWANWYTHSWDPHFYLAGKTSGVGINDVRPGAGAAVGNLRVSPNPFVSTVTFCLDKTEIIDHAIILDLEGKEIRRLDGGTASITWDGTDNNGIRVQPGAYVGMIVKDGVSIRSGIMLSN